MPGSYDGFLRADPQPSGTEYDGWLRTGVADGTGPIYLDVTGGAKATTTAGGSVAATLTTSGGASSEASGGGVPGVITTTAGGAICVTSAGGAGTFSFTALALPILLTTSRQGRIAMDNPGSLADDRAGSAEPLSAPRSDEGSLAGGRIGKVR